MLNGLLLVFFIILSLPLTGSAMVCHEILRDPALILSHQLLTVSYEDVFAGQSVVGIDYAIYKEMQMANLPPQFSVGNLSKKEKQKLLDSVYKDFEKNPLPAVRDPRGRIFLLDGHHGVYVATLLEANKKNISIKIRLVYDAYNTVFTMNDFIASATANNWFYEDTHEILTSALQVHELANSVERSMMGMLFLKIVDDYDIPMKGKHFTPFVQFYLIDLIQQLGLFTFPATFQNSQVPLLEKILLSNADVLLFWLNHLRPTAPAKLRQFLNDAYEKAANAQRSPVAN